MKVYLCARMKLVKIICIALLAHTTCIAQTSKAKKTSSTPSKDYVMLQLGYDTWLNAPDSLHIGGLGRCANIYLMYDFPIQKSNFSFAAGAGIGTSHIFLKDTKAIINDTASQVKFVADTLYKRYKYATSYIEAPFEVRYFSNTEDRNKGFKAALGLRVGALVAAHTKGKYKYAGKPIVEKVSTKRFIETYRVAATARVGWGNFSVFTSYSLNNLFRLNNGPQNISPLSIGLCLSGL